MEQSIDIRIVPRQLTQPFKEAKQNVVEEFERRYLIQVLDECDDVISRAARLVGMHKKNFHEKMPKYGIRKQKSHFQ